MKRFINCQERVKLRGKKKKEKKRRKKQFDKHVCGTMYKNVGIGWKPNINLRSSGLNKHIEADSSLIKRGYSNKSNASEE